MDANRQGLCQESAGFLFSHPCGNIAVGQCSECGKQVCTDHLLMGETTQLCTACAKLKGNVDDPNARQYDSNPYFYGHRRYRGWGQYGAGCWGAGHYDSDDFTEADGRSSVAEGAGDFERSPLDS